MPIDAMPKSTTWPELGDVLSPTWDSTSYFSKCFDPILHDLLNDFQVLCPNMPSEGLEWVRRCFEYNVLGGKLNRGISVIDTLRIIRRSDNRPLPEQDVRHAIVLGWCIEWVQASMLVADDIMDKSVTRRGKPCWYKIPEVGMNAVNDTLLLESTNYRLLRLYLRKHPQYLDIVELFKEVELNTEIGQMFDLLTAPEDNVDLTRFTMDKYKLIVKYKTAFYSFYLPVALALLLDGRSDEKTLSLSRDILLALGEYFQIQDDYLDCYGDPKVIGKIGTDIQDNKCSWLVITALTLVTPEQRSLLEKHYGRKEPQNVTAVKKLYSRLNLEELYRRYEETSFTKISGMIEKLDDKIVPREVFRAFMRRIYKRSK